ncbi:MAG: hypothetical protein ACRC2T_19525, partial [Thermoguttaceae bacterium]
MKIATYLLSNRTVLRIMTIVLVLLILFFTVAKLTRFVLFSEGRWWIKRQNYIAQHGLIFDVDSPETAEILSKKSFTFSLTPEITASFLNGSVVRENGIV